MYQETTIDSGSAYCVRSMRHPIVRGESYGYDLVKDQKGYFVRVYPTKWPGGIELTRVSRHKFREHFLTKGSR